MPHPVILLGQDYPCLQDMLHDITNRGGDHIQFSQSDADDFYDTVLGELHNGGGIFDLKRPISTQLQLSAYLDDTLAVSVRDVSENFLTRLMYNCSSVSGMLRVMPLLTVLRHADITVPSQFLCCAAAYPPQTTCKFSNTSAGKFSWCKLLIMSLGFPVVSDSKTLRDIRVNSILDLTHPQNVKYVLQSVIKSGMTRVTVTYNTWERIHHQAKTDLKVAGLLESVTLQYKLKFKDALI